MANPALQSVLSRAGWTTVICSLGADVPIVFSKAKHHELRPQTRTSCNKLRKGTKQSSKVFCSNMYCTVSSFWICGQVQQAGTHNDTDLWINLLMCCTCGTLRPRSVLSRQRRTNTCCQGNLVDLDVDLTRAKAEQNELDAWWHRSSGRALQRVKQWKQVLVRKQFNANWPHYIWLDF